MSTSVWPSLPANQLKKAEDESVVGRNLSQIIRKGVNGDIGERAFMASGIIAGDAGLFEGWTGRLLCVIGADRAGEYAGDELGEE